ncbi:MAG TPA: sigma-70 family RNA polymerase sigma factor [Verrucomicrobiae bacterium]|nr:sigma-70 family RNA polymerase sigma factor [Verrucomicrobiae bacterium]
MITDPSDSIATRASLLGRLKNWEDADSWEEFTRTYWRLIYGVARQAGLSDDEARDVVQETLLGVAKKVHEFESSPDRGSFKNWMLNVTRWRIADHYRNKPPQAAVPSRRADPDGTATSERVADPADLDEFWEEEWKKSVLETALARLRRRVKPKHAQIFDLYAVRGWPAAKVGANLGVSVFQIYLVAHRLSRLLKEEVRYVSKKLE